MDYKELVRLLNRMDRPVNSANLTQLNIHIHDHEAKRDWNPDSCFHCDARKRLMEGLLHNEN